MEEVMIIITRVRSGGIDAEEKLILSYFMGNGL